MSLDAQNWEDVYAQGTPQALPWNAGGPDSDLVRLVEDGTIPVGQALDLGTGPGHDAVFLIQKGFNVIGIDISPSAIKLARETASNTGVFGFFQEGDIRHIPIEDHFIDFVYDRGCFHVLPMADWAQAAGEIHRVLHKGGLFLLRVFSDKEPPGMPATLQAGPPDEWRGPHRFTRKELDDVFGKKFRTLKFWEGVFEGSRKPKSYSILMEKR